MTIGAQAIVEAAESFAQKRPSGLEYDAIKAVNVPASPAVRLIAQKASFQHKTILKRAAEATPPHESGKTICLSSSHVVLPSILLASRISTGISLKYENNNYIIIGRFIIAKIMINTVLVSKRPAESASKYTGIITPTAGNILVESIQSKISFVKRPGKNAIE